MTFWIYACAMMAVVLGIIFLPWIRRTERLTPSLQDSELGIYRQKKQELEQDLQLGLLSDEIHGEAIQELEHALACDLNTIGQENHASPEHRKSIWVALGVSFIVLAIPVFLYSILGFADEYQSYLHDEKIQREKVAEMQHAIKKLEGHLQTHPDDGEAWRWLGRTQLSLGALQQSSEAFTKAEEYIKNDPDLLLDHAQALILLQNESRSGPPAILIKQALALAPDNKRALWEAARLANEEGNFSIAITHLELLIKQLEPGSEDEKIVRSSLESLQNQVTGQSTETSTENKAEVSLLVQVDVAAAIKSTIQPQDTVFIFARAVTGPAMPLAVVKVKASQLPTTVTLDDSTAMSPSLKLSNYAEVIVGARISSSGNPMPQVGDKQGYTANPVQVNKGGKNPIVIHIDQIVE